MDDSDHPPFLRTPHLGRIHDYILGGSLNTPLDRRVAEELRSRVPILVSLIKRQRDFLAAAVTHMLGQGIRQFVVLGSGLPTAGHVHSIAHRRSIPATTVYVDSDTSTVEQAEIILAGNQRTTVLRGDFMEPETVLASLDRRTAVDRNEPTGLFLIGALDTLPAPRRPHRLIAAYRNGFSRTCHLAGTLLAAPPNSDVSADVGTAAKILGDIGSTLIVRPRGTLHVWLSKIRPRGTAVDTGFAVSELPPAEGTAGQLTFDHALMRFS